MRLAIKLRLPLDSLIKRTIFTQFCGGETIEECRSTVQTLAAHKIGTILDYSVEGNESETHLDQTCEEILRTISIAQANPDIPFCVFKMTGIARFSLLMNPEAGGAEKKAEWKRATRRLQRLCESAVSKGVRLFIDAEESWIQHTIDSLAEQMMEQFNTQIAYIFTTVQMYRTDRMAYLQRTFSAASAGNYFLGVKLVRGAYMEKERLRARLQGYRSPIQPAKQSTDEAYDEALRFCMERIERISLCAGTHNENSTRLLTQLIDHHKLSRNDARVYFSQLLGMSDHLSYNLASEGYNVAKYVPYGPVRAMVPYLIRRAQENTSIQGQTGRELSLITAELRRRRFKQMVAPPPVVYFDGVCGLCNRFVDFLFRTDRHGRLRFSPLQGETARSVLPESLRQGLFGIVLKEHNTIYKNSTAVIRIFYHLGGLWRAFWLLRFIPQPLRDGVYRFVAARRYKIFGKTETCRLPTAAEAKRFLP